MGDDFLDLSDAKSPVNTSLLYHWLLWAGERWYRRDRGHNSDMTRKYEMFIMRTFLISSSIAAIMALSVAPIGHDISFATEVDPPVLEAATERAVAQPPPTIRASFTDVESDAINQLREFILATSEETVLGGKAAKLIGLVETDRSVPTKQVSVALTEEIRYFTVSTEPNSDDIILTIKRDMAVRRMYLTNSKFILRAAVVHEDGTPQVVPNEQAAAGFEALLMFWVEKSKSLQAGHTHHH
jgi:hypothetical protein